MAFYFRTDINFGPDNPVSNISPTNGVNVYIGSTPGTSINLISENNKSYIKVYFDNVLSKTFELDYQYVNDSLENMGDLNWKWSSRGSIIYTKYPIKIPNDAVTMRVESDVYVYSYDDEENSYATYISNSQTYTFNSPPEISGTDSDIGVKNSAFKLDFSVNDANENDVLSVIGYFNNEVFFEKSDIERKKMYSLEITNQMLAELDVGTRNEIIIEVSDTKSVSRRIYSFQKESDLDTYCEYLTDPVILAEKPNCVLMAQSVSCNSNVDTKVYVCNNALDNNPIWEDMTNEYLLGMPHYFTNNICYSDKWAICFKVINAKTDIESVITTYGIGFITNVSVIGDDGLPYQTDGFATNYTFGDMHTLTWANPVKNFTATKIVRNKNRMPMGEIDGTTIYDGEEETCFDTLDPYDNSYFDHEVYWEMIENKDYTYWTDVANSKKNDASVDGDMYFYRKFPYKAVTEEITVDGVTSESKKYYTQTQQYNSIVALTCRGKDYPYPEGSITVDEKFFDTNGSIEIPVNGIIPGNTVEFYCSRDNRVNVVSGEFIEDNGTIKVTAISPGISEISAYTGAAGTETKTKIKVCDILHLRINICPRSVIDGEKNLITYRVTDTVGNELTDKCLLHYGSDDKTIDDRFVINILGGGNAEITYNSGLSDEIGLNKYHFWVEIDGMNYEKEIEIYLRSFGIEV